ncbi:MAG TPA: VOC family protein [Casimicrobiaceae bacterium]|nr:VOC family protein [Casimicrobiaceae bacterium]
MSRLTGFEIQAADPAREMRFGAGLHGWTFDCFGDDGWLIPTGDPAPGIDGGLMPRRGGRRPTGSRAAHTPAWSASTTLTTRLRRSRPGRGEIVVPTFAVPSVGWLAYARDPQRNRFGVRRRDDRAS